MTAVPMTAQARVMALTERLRICYSELYELYREYPALNDCQPESFAHTISQSFDELVVVLDVARQEWPLAIAEYEAHTPAKLDNVMAHRGYRIRENSHRDIDVIDPRDDTVIYNTLTIESARNFVDAYRSGYQWAVEAVRK